MVVATDKAGLDSDPVNVSVMVTDVAETGTVTLSTDQPAVGVMITATLMEPDTKVTGESWQWQRSLDGTTDFQDIEDATSATYTPAFAVPDDTATEDIDVERSRRRGILPPRHGYVLVTTRLIRMIPLTTRTTHPRARWVIR